MRRTTTVAALATTILALGLAADLPSVAGAAPAGGAATREPTSRVTPAEDGYITTTTMPDGDVVKVYAEVPYTPKADTMSVKRASSDADGDGDVETTVSGEFDPPQTLHRPVITTSPTGTGTGGDEPAPVTAEDELLALGVSPEDAADFADMSAGPTADPGGDTGGVGGTQQAQHARHADATAAASAAPIQKPVCVSVSGDSKKLHVYGCNSTYRVATSGAVWYLEDKFQASGTMHDGSFFNPDEITGLKFGVSYPKGNQISTWSPISTTGVGSCRSNTASLSYKGVGISSTTTECPESFGLYSQDTTHFGTKWDGKGNGPSDGARATHGVDGVYNGATASPYPGVYYQYWYE